MLERSTAPRVAASVASALLLALGACGDPETSSPGGGVVDSAAGTGMTRGGASSGGAGTGNQGGRDQPGAGASGALASGSAGTPSGAGSSPGGNGSMPAGSGGGGAGGRASESGGAAGTAGTSSAPTYSTDPLTFGGQPRCQGFEVCESFESAELGALPSSFTLAGYGTRTVGVSADRA